MWVDFNNMNHVYFETNQIYVGVKSLVEVDGLFNKSALLHVPQYHKTEDYYKLDPDKWERLGTGMKNDLVEATKKAGIATAGASENWVTVSYKYIGDLNCISTRLRKEAMNKK